MSECKECERLRAALRRLVQARDELETHGDTPVYQALKRGVWEEARDALDGQPAPGNVEPRTDSRYNNAERIFGDD